MATVKETFEAMATKFRADKATGTSATIQYDVSGEGGGTWHAVIKDGACTVSGGTAPSPTLTVQISAQDWLDMLSGKQSGQMLFMSGKLKVKGDMGAGHEAGLHVRDVTSDRGNPMAQERSADVVEPSARGDRNGDLRVSSEVVKQWQDEFDRNVRRVRNLADMVLNPTRPKVGQTPREEVYKRNKSRLYRYASRRTHRTPVLFVPNLGISRPYIFDLLPGGSFIEHMTREGFDFFLLDWGVFGPEDNDLGVEECVGKILPRMARKVLEVSGASELSVLGYCMGAPLSASFVATHPRVSRAELHQHGRSHRLRQGRTVRVVARQAVLQRRPLRGHPGHGARRPRQGGLQAHQAHHGPLHQSQPLVESVER